MKYNLFSKHDNRHTLQHCGEYFGQGLGKRIDKGSVRNQHRSDNHASWGSSPTYSSTYRQCYSTDSSLIKHKRSLSATPSSSFETNESLLYKFDVLTKPNFRRYPHEHSPDNLVSIKSEDLVSTTYSEQKLLSRAESADGGTVRHSRDRQHRARSYTTPLYVLAATQQPFQGHTPWKYSYKQWLVVLHLEFIFQNYKYLCVNFLPWIFQCTRHLNKLMKGISSEKGIIN